jgi:hypothetical protein
LREIEAAAERIGAHAVNDDERVVGFTAAREEGGEGAGAARPGTLRSAAPSVNCCLASISSPPITVTLSGVRDSG